LSNRRRLHDAWPLAALALGVGLLVFWIFRDDAPNSVAPFRAEDRASPAPSARTAAARARRERRVPAWRVEKLDAGVTLTIDGKLDEAAWRTAPNAELVDVRSGEPNRDFPVNARVVLLWDALGFYVGFDVQDANVSGGFPEGAKDPHLWTRDTVEIMVDPDGDGDNADYYEIQIGPQNLIFDSAFDAYNEPRTEPNGPFGHEEWSSQAKSAVVVRGTLDRTDDRDQGYSVEAFLPWKAFSKAKHVPPAIGDTWRLNFYAMQDNGGVAWSPILSEGNFHRASRFGRVTWTEKGAPLPRAERMLDAGLPRNSVKALDAPSTRSPLWRRSERPQAP
jgi:hypothetical protein